MQELLTICRALGDESRVRSLLALRGGELCLCQLIELLELSPSTVSRHMKLLHDAGLVERRKDGKWHYYRLAPGGAAAPTGRALDWAIGELQGDPAIAADDRALKRLRRRSLEELSACYRG